MSKIDPPPSAPRMRVSTWPLLVGAVVLAALPWLTALYQEGTLAQTPRELWSSTAASLVAIAFAAWVIVLLRRERETARQHLADLEALTLTDPLTGLGNRRALERELGRAMLRSRRLDHPLSLLFLDVDDLKQVNDRFGHAGGDETLRVVANVTRACSREGTDASFRVGGDEFVLVVLADYAGAEVLSQRIRHGFATRSPYESSVSVGVMEWDGAMTAGELLSEADRLMYRSKQTAQAPAQRQQRH